MLAVAVGDASDEESGEDQRTVETNGSDYVVEDTVMGSTCRASSRVLEKPKSATRVKYWSTP